MFIPTWLFWSFPKAMISWQALWRSSVSETASKQIIALNCVDSVTISIFYCLAILFSRCWHIIENAASWMIPSVFASFTKATIRSSYKEVAENLAEHFLSSLVFDSSTFLLSQIFCNSLIRTPNHSFMSVIESQCLCHSYLQIVWIVLPLVSSKHASFSNDVTIKVTELLFHHVSDT